MPAIEFEWNKQKQLNDMYRDEFDITFSHSIMLLQHIVRYNVFILREYLVRKEHALDEAEQY